MISKNRTRELAEAQEDLLGMYSELSHLQTRIAKQKRKIALLSELSGLDEDSGPPKGLVKGITDACLTALRGSDRPLTPSEVRDRIIALGIKGDNILASVHTILKRLIEQGKAKEEGGAYRRLTLLEQIKNADMGC